MISMIDGVTLVNTANTAIAFDICQWILVVGLAALLCVVIAYSISLIKRKEFLKNGNVFFCAICLVLIAFANYLLFSPTMRRATKEPRYEVTVSDKVSFNDFMANYEIVGRHGDIYSVRKIGD